MPCPQTEGRSPRFSLDRDQRAMTSTFRFERFLEGVARRAIVPDP